MPDEPKPPKRRRRPRKSGDLATAKRVLWGAIRDAEAVLLGANGDPDTVLRATHALQQAVSSYGRILETTDLAARVEELEKRLLDQGNMRRVV